MYDVQTLLKVVSLAAVWCPLLKLCLTLADFVFFYLVIHFNEKIFHSSGYCLMAFKKTADIILLANQFYVCGKVCFRSEMGSFGVI